MLVTASLAYDLLSLSFFLSIHTATLSLKNESLQVIM